jgi:hypothetical protein
MFFRSFARVFSRCSSSSRSSICFEIS